MNHYRKITIIGLAGMATVMTILFTLLVGFLPIHTSTISSAPLETLHIETTNPYQEPLEQMVNEFGDQYSSTTGLYVIDLSNDAQASYNESRQFVSASLYKLFVAYLILDAADANTLELSSTVQETGTTIEYCLDIMITISDNTCGKALGDLLDWQTIDERLHNEGYTGTVLDNYDSAGSLIADKLTTSEDVADLLRRLYDNELLSSQSTQQFMALLQSQTLDYALPTGLDSDISFAHKTGVLGDVSHDAGFLTYQDRTLLVVMMTDGWTDPYTQSISQFAELGGMLSLYIKSTHVPHNE